MQNRVIIIDEKQGEARWVVDQATSYPFHASYTNGAWGTASLVASSLSVTNIALASSP